MDAEAERLFEVCEAEDIDAVREVVTNDDYYRGTEYTCKNSCGVVT